MTSTRVWPATGAGARDPSARRVRERLTEELAPSAPRGVGVQVGLDELGTPLREVTFVVVDLETTGTGARASITEIGAVKIRGERDLAEFHTLVDPGVPIAPRISALTGISDRTVAGAPDISVAYPAFARFAGIEDEGGGLAPRPACALVAHNARFDVGFLRRAARDVGHAWPRDVRVVDTLALARLALPRPAVANHRLPTLARRFHIARVREHRALDDARTTVQVLRALLADLEPLGVDTLEDTMRLGRPVPARRRRQVVLAADVPPAAGVYRFFDRSGDTLYIGSSANLRSRVRSYFSASERRPRVRRMLDVTKGVSVQTTETLLQARVEELHEIRRSQPLFNVRSTHQEAAHWVLRRGRVLDVVSSVPTDAAHRALGPYRGSRRAQLALRILAGLLAPHDEGFHAAGTVSDAARADAWLAGASSEAFDILWGRIERAGEEGRFESAARLRDQLAAYAEGLERSRELYPVGVARRAIWARRRAVGGWELQACSWGRLVRTFLTPPRTSPLPWLEAIRASDPDPRPAVFLATTTWEETRLIATEILRPGSRLIEWDCPVSLAEPVGSPLARTGVRERLRTARRR